MKKTVICALALASVSVFGQGRVSLQTATGSPVAGYMKAVYQNADAAPFGFADGTPVGAGVVVGLYAGATADSLTLYGPLTRFVTSGAGTGFVTTGVGDVTRTLSAANTPGGTGPTLPDSVPAFFQLRAWSTGYNTYEACQAAITALGQPLLLGMSSIVQATPTSSAGSPPPTAAQIPWGGKTSATAVIWYVEAVPEPSTFVLGALGVLGMLLIRRRK